MAIVWAAGRRCTVRDSTVRITVIVLADKDDVFWFYETESDNIVHDSRQTPTVDHFRIGIHVDSAVDGTR